MSFNIDDVFPNFTIFVLILLPVAILITVVGFLIRKFMARSSLGKGRGHTFDEILGYLPALYFLWPIYDIVSYFLGNIEFTTVLGRLFTTHLRGFTIVMLLAGIGQVVYYVYSHWRSRKGTVDDEVVVVGRVIGRAH